MTSPTTIRVLAMSDRQVFLAVHEDEYCVFSVGDTHEIAIGDALRGDFDGHSASTFTAQNLTQNDSPRIDLNDWGLPLDQAIGRLLALHSPDTCVVGSKTIRTDSPVAAAQVREEIVGVS